MLFRTFFNLHVISYLCECHCKELVPLFTKQCLFVCVCVGGGVGMSVDVWTSKQTNSLFEQWLNSDSAA